MAYSGAMHEEPETGPGRPHYSQSGLDRASERRRDTAWIQGALHERESRVIPVWQDLNLILTPEGATPEAVHLTGAHARGLLQIADGVAFLGIGDRDTPYFACDVSSQPMEALSPLIGHGGETKFINLRTVGPLMADTEASLLAFARGLMYWHRRHRYCGDCGTATSALDAGWVRACANPACEARHFPRTDPAVIVLVTRPGPDGGAALLGRQATWPAGMMSALAGFIEPGESAEDAVRREVREEAGIEVAETSFVISQPWPFPSSLMMAYRARASTVHITLADGELEDARWFTRQQVRNMEANGYKRPRVDSIAHVLIQQWLDEDA